eukprot:TRINITY_DN792_c0_g1_i1.p1 TRINITY_DN792_c0_g1~~TRINITY_DN792_c0_g1_i1.p1  ORF type:complete len:630 (-),score=40.74 TRINITY_DN792_c0_g1_i1:1513-3402(-)
MMFIRVFCVVVVLVGLAQGNYSGTGPKDEWIRPGTSEKLVGAGARLAAEQVALQAGTPAPVDAWGPCPDWPDTFPSTNLGSAVNFAEHTVSEAKIPTGNTFFLNANRCVENLVNGPYFHKRLKGQNKEWIMKLVKKEQTLYSLPPYARVAWTSDMHTGIKHIQKGKRAEKKIASITDSKSMYEFNSKYNGVSIEGSLGADWGPFSANVEASYSSSEASKRTKFSSSELFKKIVYAHTVQPVAYQSIDWALGEQRGPQQKLPRCHAWVVASFWEDLSQLLTLLRALKLGVHELDKALMSRTVEGLRFRQAVTKFLSTFGTHFVDAVDLGHDQKVQAVITASTESESTEISSMISNELSLAVEASAWFVKASASLEQAEEELKQRKKEQKKETFSFDQASMQTPTDNKFAGSIGRHYEPITTYVSKCGGTEDQKNLVTRLLKWVSVYGMPGTASCLTRVDVEIRGQNRFQVAGIFVDAFGRLAPTQSTQSREPLRLFPRSPRSSSSRDSVQGSLHATYYYYKCKEKLQPFSLMLDWPNNGGEKRRLATLTCAAVFMDQNLAKAVRKELPERPEDFIQVRCTEEKINGIDDVLDAPAPRCRGHTDRFCRPMEQCSKGYEYGRCEGHTYCCYP